MKKVKNTESSENDTSLKIVKEGKVKKNKSKKENKFKDAEAEMKNLNLAPKIGITNLKPINDVGKTRKKNKKTKLAAKLEQNQESTEEPQKLSDEIQKKQKKNNKDKPEKSVPETPSKDLTEAELKKKEKKKAKKLAQKLKRREKKNENKDGKVTATASTNGAKKVKSLKITAKKVVSTSGKVTIQKLENPAVDSTSSEVLAKKEKKAQKRQLIKEQKLAEKQTRDPAVEAATVFVGNVPINTKRIQIVRLFKDFGPVNSIRLRSAGGQILFKHKQRKIAGALNAYVVLKNKETAEKALSLNGVEFKNHHLRVTLAAKNPQFHEKEEAKKTVFVGSLKYTATEESLREIFSSCGEIDYVRCIRDGDKGCKGVAYVCFKTTDAVGLALELNGTILDDRPINVERFSVRKLGAKEARDAQAEKEVTSKKGARQRLDGKKGKKDKSSKEKKSSGVDDDDVKKPKKSEFRGIKVEGLKKKSKSKKKKSNDQMAQLAKKIAPKAKTE